MFSYDDRLKAVELLREYDMSYADTICELGYPTRQALRKWYCECRDNGKLRQGSVKKPKYSLEQRQKAVDYYVEHGKSISRTVKNIGYPSRQALGEWITELAPDQKKHCCAGGTVVKYPRELKEHAVISLCSRSKPAKDVAAEYGTTRETLYIWKRQLLDKGCATMKTNDSEPTKTNNGQKIDTEISNLDVTRKELEQQVVDPQNEVRRLKLERDIYEKAAEILKKDEGISLKYLSN